MSTAPFSLQTQTTCAGLVRAEVESSLAGRFAGALSPAPRPVRETMPCGIPALDELLGGGLPVGAISELVGPASSGRTGVAVRTMAAAMREGNHCAWVDASDAFDPESAAANGVCLEQLLWVRCGVQAAVERPSEAGRAPGTHVRSAQPAPAPARAGQHARDEVRGLDRAVGDLLHVPPATAARTRNRVIGTPGAPNRPLDQAGMDPCCCPPEAGGMHAGRAGGVVPVRFAPVPRQEQVSSDRQAKRGRGAENPGPMLKQGMALPEEASLRARSAKGYGRGAAPWSRLEQALRAADLLLQGGGFRVLVLDLGSLEPEQVLRVPLATWFRFRAAADASRTVLLALTRISCAKSSAGLVVHFDPLAASGGAPTVLQGLRYQAEMGRQRFNTEQAAPVISIHHTARRRPPQATWQLSPYPVQAEAGYA